jgi:hypothetical protein
MDTEVSFQELVRLDWRLVVAYLAIGVIALFTI